VDLLLKPVHLSMPPPDGYLRYGDTIQILAAGPTCKVAVDAFPFRRDYCRLSHLALSASVPPEAIDNAPYLNTDSIFSASPLLFPVVRNSFIVEHPECPTKVGQIVEYGEPFRIRAFDTQRFPLYLFSAPAIRLHVGAVHSGKPKVRFSDLATPDSLWSIFPLDPDEKLRMGLGVPVRLKAKVIVRHHMTGNNLSLEPNFPVATYFGCELEVTVDSKADRVKKTCTGFENIWYLDVDRQLEEDKECCEKEFEKQAEFSAKINANVINRSAAEEEKEPDPDPDDESSEICIPERYFQPLECPSPRIMEEPVVVKEKDKLPNYNPLTDYRHLKYEELKPFANQKWNCAEPNCFVLPNPVEKEQDCKCKCIETPPSPAHPRGPGYFKRLIM